MKNLSKVMGLMLIVIFMMGLAFPASADGHVLAAESCDYGGIIQSIEAVDELTVKFTLCQPDPAFLSKVAFSAFGIHPSEYIEATGGGGLEFNQNPIGTGPYAVDVWQQGSEIVMTRHDDYWGDPALEPTLIFRWNSEAAARLTELQAGTVDGIDNPGPADFEVIEADPNLELYPRAGTNIFYLGLNNFFEPFDNVAIRQAVAHGIDRERIVANFYPPGSQAATQFMPPSIPSGYTPEVEPFPYDPDIAAALVAESGLELPIEFTIFYRDVVRSYLPTPGQVGQDIATQLESIEVDGVQAFEVTVEVMESGTFLAASDNGELQSMMLGWGADYPDATNFLDFHFGAGASDQFGEKFEAITDPLARAAQLVELEERNEIYAEANAAIRDLVPMVPIAHGGSGVAYRAEIGGFPHSSPLGNEYFGVMEDPSDDVFVWMQNAEPSGIYCGDQTDGEALRVCEQINEPLMGYEIGGTAVVPLLAESFVVNDELTEWTFNLREGVVFHDGSAFDSMDVLASYGMQWDASSPYHVGNNGDFTYFSALFGGFINADEE